MSESTLTHADTLLCQAETREECDNPVHWVTLPYPEADGTHTAGWSGSEASQERAVEERDNGTVTYRQNMILDLLRTRGSRGITVRELRTTTGWHHGQASGMLSNLHKAERILRLDDKRDRCHIYVLPEFSLGRSAKPQGRQHHEDAREWLAFEAGFKACFKANAADIQMTEDDIPMESRAEYVAWVIEGMK